MFLFCGLNTARQMVGTWRQTVRDGTVLAAIGTALLAVHFWVPVDVRAQLVFDHERVAPWSLLTAAYVHNSTQHLLGNLVGYGIGAAIAYLLCVGQDRRRWFWMTTSVFLIVLPILVNVTSYAAFQTLGLEPTSRGFSGVVAGFVGFILVALARQIADDYGLTVGWRVGQGVFLLLLGEISVIYTGMPSLLISGLLVVGLGLSFGQLGLQGLRQDWDATERRKVALDMVFAGLVVVLLIVYVWILFPATLVQRGTVTNIAAHGLGFLSGILLSTFLLVGR